MPSSLIGEAEQIEMLWLPGLDECTLQGVKYQKCVEIRWGLTDALHDGVVKVSLVGKVEVA
jgi:hypothetical protein